MLTLSIRFWKLVYIGLIIFLVLNYLNVNAQIVTGWENHKYIPDKVERKFSKYAQQGELTKVNFPLLAMSKNRYVIIDDKTYHLTPGVRFYTQKNNLIIPPSKTETPVDIAFIEVNGYISRLWVLNEEEADNFKDYQFK